MAQRVLPHMFGCILSMHECLLCHKFLGTPMSLTKVVVRKLGGGLMVKQYAEHSKISSEQRAL